VIIDDEERIGKVDLETDAIILVPHHKPLAFPDLTDNQTELLSVNAPAYPTHH
jgi:hypothetical protein